jgi:hypothetical protein
MRVSHSPKLVQYQSGGTGMSSRVWIVNLLNVAVLAAFVGLFVGCGEVGGETTIRDIDPKVGHMQGDQPVRIIGENFKRDIGYAVYFGTRKAGNATNLGPNTLIVTTPGRMPAGKVDVLIQADNGVTFKLPQAFEFKEMAGNVVGGFGKSATATKKEKGNLAY